MEAKVTLSQSIEMHLGRASIGLRSLRAANSDRPNGNEIELLRNGHLVPISNRSNPLLAKGSWPRTVGPGSGGHGRAFPGRDRRPACFSIRLITTTPLRSGTRSESPVELGVRGGDGRGQRDPDLSRHLLHRHAGQHATTAARIAVGREAGGRRVLRPGRQ